VRGVDGWGRGVWAQLGGLVGIGWGGRGMGRAVGGPDLVPLLKKYQPQAICFQGPKDFPNNVRWVGNEDGLAPEDCFASTSAGEARYDGTVPDEKAGVGDPDGKYYWPAETDMPNRSHKGFGGGWFWREGEEDTVFTPEHLLDCYIRSVGRNSNLLLGMGISTDGDFKDEEQFRTFGELLRKTFSNPLLTVENPTPAEGDRYEVHLETPEKVRFLVIRENITEGQHIRGYEVYVNGTKFYEGRCIGHKRILRLDTEVPVSDIQFVVTEDDGVHTLRDLVLYR
ncbi:MAG: hypothetical protein MJ175_11530, partial [Clostridia bacterium]|nr:hypothetical protein [Clostridia bacterium]